MVGKKKFFGVKPVEHWKTPFWERNVSEHNIQHTQIAIDVFIFYTHKVFCS